MIDKENLIKLIEDKLIALKDIKDDNINFDIAPLKDVLERCEFDKEYQKLFLVDVSDEIIKKLLSSNEKVASLMYLKRLFNLNPNIILTSDQEEELSLFRECLHKYICSNENISSNIFVSVNKKSEHLNGLLKKLKELLPLDKDDYLAVDYIDVPENQKEDIVDYLNEYNINLFNNIYTQNSHIAKLYNDLISYNSDIKDEETSLDSTEEVIDINNFNETESYEEIESIFNPFETKSFDYVKPVHTVKTKEKNDKDEYLKLLNKEKVVETVELLKENPNLYLINVDEFKEKIGLLKELNLDIKEVVTSTSFMYADLDIVKRNIDILKIYGFNINDITINDLTLLELTGLNVMIDSFIELNMNDYIHLEEGMEFKKLKSLIIKRLFYSYKNELVPFESFNNFKVLNEEEIKDLVQANPILESLEEGYRLSLFTDSYLANIKRKTEFIFENQLVSRIKTYSVLKYILENAFDSKRAVIDAILTNTDFDTYTKNTIESIINKIMG